METDLERHTEHARDLELPARTCTWASHSTTIGLPRPLHALIERDDNRRHQHHFISPHLDLAYVAGARNRPMAPLLTCTALRPTLRHRATPHHPGTCMPLAAVARLGRRAPTYGDCSCLTPEQQEPDALYRRERASTLLYTAMSLQEGGSLVHLLAAVLTPQGQ